MTKLLTAITVFISSLVTSVSSVLPISLHKTEETPKNNSSVLGINTDPIYFTINTPANFKQNITAPNVLYSITGGKGVTISGTTQNPTINNDGVLSLQVQTGELTLTGGDGIALDGLKITNSGIKSLSAGDGISIDGNKITNTGILSLSAGDGISIDGNKITNTRPVPNYTLTGWTDSGDTVSLTDLSDSVLIDAVSFGNISITNGNALTPDTDLGSDLGDSTHRFDDLMVANIFSNHSQNFSGQSIFSYIPQNSTLAEASVIINPTTAALGGQLLGLSLGGYEKATIDKEGDLVIGYSGNTSTPVNDYPLNIYGHSGTSVAHFDTSGNLTMGDTLTTSGVLNIDGSVNTQDLNINSGVLSVTDKVGIGTTTPSEMLTVNGGIDATSIYTQSLGNSLAFGNSADTISLTTNGSATPSIYMYGSGNLNIGSTGTNGYKLDVAGTATISGATTMGSTLNVNGTTTLNSLTAVSAILTGNLTAEGNTTMTGKLGIGTTDPTSSLDIATETNVDALRLTNSGVKVAGISTGATNSVVMDITSQNVTNRLTNGTFETNLSGWTGAQTYTLNDEFTDTAPTVLATSTPVTLQSSGVTNPAPVLGNELIINSDFLSWTNGKPDGWSINNDSDIDPDLSEVGSGALHGGAGNGSVNFFSTSTQRAPSIGQSFGYQTNKWLQMVAVISARTPPGLLYIRDNVGNIAENISALGSYTRIKRMTNGSYITIDNYTYNPVNQTIDSFSLKPLTLSSLFSAVPVAATGTSTDYTVQADTTLTARTQAGLVMNLDSTSSPANFIIAYHDGTKVYLDKNVGGTYTNLINTAATYVPGATIKVVKNGFNYSLYYNGVQKGTTQVITDAGIVNNTNHGVFSTYASNSFSNFLVQSQVSNPVPVLGSNLITNGNMETGNPPSNWTSSNGTLTQISDERTGGTGSYSLNMAFLSYGYPTVYQNITTDANTWYSASAWTKMIVGGNVALRADARGSNTWILGGNTSTDKSWVQIFGTGHAYNTTSKIWFESVLAAGQSVNVDDVTMQPLTLPSLFSTVNVGNANVVASASATITSNTQAGLVLNLDSISNPQNFVIAYHDGKYMHLEKAVAGTYTSLINTATTYVAGANITVRKNGTRYTLVYNGTQVGTDQTISDAGIINNTIHGLFSTYAGNIFTNFSIKTNIDGTLATDGVNVRTVLDTRGTLSITNDTLRINGSVQYGNPGIVYPSTNRVLGKTLIGNVVIPSGTDTMFGWKSNTALTSGSSNESAFDFTNPNLILPHTGSQGARIADTATGTSYELALTLRNSGAYYYIRGGTYSNWTLLWSDTTKNSSTVYPNISAGFTNNNFTSNYINIPTSLWLPTPLAYDTFTTDGATSTEAVGPDGQTTPQLTWTGGTKSNGTMSITPIGTELITNGDMETGNPPSNWELNGTPTVTGSADEHTGGNGSQSINVASTGVGAAQSVRQSIATPPAGTWVLLSGWLKNISGAYADIQYYDSAGGLFLLSTSASWTNYYTSGRVNGNNAYVYCFPYLSGPGEVKCDDISAKSLTLSSLFATIPSGKSDIIADVNIIAKEGNSASSGPQSGIVTNLNNVATPSAGIVAYLTRTNTTTGASITLDKFTTATTWTNIQAATTVTYVPGATLRVITYHSDANTLKVRVYYNNALVGSEQTVTDASIINNTNHGLFSTYSGNTFDNFTLWSRGSGGEYAQLTPEDLTVTRDTSVKFAGSTASAKLVAGSTYNDFTQTVNVGDTSTYTLTAYAYTNGSAVTASDLELYYGSSSITTTYTPLGGEGWYRLQGTVTGIASNQPAGVRVKAGKTVYVDNITLSNGVASPTTMYVFNSGTGKANLNVQGLVDGTLSGIATFSKAGTISDSDFTSTASGMLAVDTLNHRLYFREADGWSYIARTGGFQIPVEETEGLTEGDLLLPYVESKMSDGALHGLYQKFSDFSQSGTANIAKDADHIDVTFSNPFIKAPIVNITSHTSLGRGASVKNVSSSGFTIALDLPALTDYTYSWKALLVSEPLVSQSQSVFADFMKLLEATPSATPSANLQ